LFLGAWHALSARSNVRIFTFVPERAKGVVISLYDDYTSTYPYPYSRCVWL